MKELENPFNYKNTNQIDRANSEVNVEPQVINFGGHINMIKGHKINSWIVIDGDNKVLGIIDNKKFYGSHKYGLQISDLYDVIEMIANTSNTREEETG